jgi:hypothetical protein
MRTTLPCAATLLLLAACAPDDTVAAAPAKPDVTAGAETATVQETPKSAALPTFSGGEEPGVRYLHLTGEWLDDAKRMRVQVYVGKFPELFGIAGHLHYDPDALELISLKPEHLPRGPVAQADWLPVTLAEDTPKGRILLGGARFRTKPSAYEAMVGVKVERELWLTAEFAPKKAATTQVAFDTGSITARTAGGEDLVVAAPPAVVAVPEWPLAAGAP